MRRLIVVLLLGVLLAASILDPYAMHANASDAVLDAPWWQSGLALLDAGLLAIALWLVLRNHGASAIKLIGIEALFNLVLSVGWVLRDGVGRFLHGFGGKEYLSVYLTLVALRIVLLLIVSPEQLTPEGLSKSSVRPR
jgi:hypothetical protein